MTIVAGVHFYSGPGERRLPGRNGGNGLREKGVSSLVSALIPQSLHFFPLALCRPAKFLHLRLRAGPGPFHPSVPLQTASARSLNLLHVDSEVPLVWSVLFAVFSSLDFKILPTKQ